MRYYLDTNILVYLLEDKVDELSSDTIRIFGDYQNILLTSTVCVKELIHLCQTGKVGSKKKGRGINVGDVLSAVQNMNIRIEPVNTYHLGEYAGLPFHGDHSDPDDRLIIAQAISDRIPLVSSDRKFHYYEEDGLDLVFNRR